MIRWCNDCSQEQEGECRFQRYNQREPRQVGPISFKMCNAPSGVANLNHTLDINSTIKTPDLRYKLGDADATSLKAWTYGAALPRVAVATPPTYNAGSPGLSANDDSCKFNASDCFRCADTTTGNVGTKDIVARLAFETSGTTSVIAAKRNAGIGWEIGIDASDRLYLTIEDSGGAVTVVSAALTAGQWVFADIYGDRSGSAQIYINKAASGAAVDISAKSGTLDSATALTIGDDSGGNAPYDARVAFFSLYSGAAWLDTHLQAAQAVKSHLLWSGHWPQIATNSGNKLVDGDMEGADVSAWTADDSTLTKDTTAPLNEGTKHLRITSTGNTFWAVQTVATTGVYYRITGAARSVSGSAIPSIALSSGGTPWAGTTSTDWQEFDVITAGNGTGIKFGSASSHPGVVDFDNVKVTCLGHRPISSTRAFAAYLDKVESGVRKLYYMGGEHLRMCHRQDSGGVNVRGYLPETQAENLFPYSEAFANWDLIEAGTVVVDNAEVCPDGRTVMASIAGDSDDEQHGIEDVVTLTADTYAYSGFSKPGDKGWIYVNNSTVANCDCYFDVTNGVEGTAGAGCVGYIEPNPWLNDSYRWCIVFTGTAAAHTLQVSPAVADGDNDFVGDGSTVNTYVWGAQCELGDYMTSPIITAGATATRLKDNLQFVAGDNIGGEDVGKGSIYADVLLTIIATGDARVLCSISDGGAAGDRIDLQINARLSLLPLPRLHRVAMPVLPLLLAKC